MRPTIIKHIIILFALSCILFLSGNALVGLTNDNEVLYAQAAKEMMQHDTWLTPYLFGTPLFEKPIFIYWLTRIGFLIFGVSGFGARFFPAVFAAFGIVAVYLIGVLGLKDEKKAFLCSIILMSSGLYTGMAKTLFTDMVFSVLMAWSLLFFFWGYVRRDKKNKGLLWCSAFIGVAVLTKGPLGFLIPSGTIVLFLLFKKDLKFLLSRSVLWGIVVLICIIAPWYVAMIKEYGSAFIREFIFNDHIRRLFEAQHESNDHWYFYPVLIINCMIPWSIFVVAALVSVPRLLRQKENTFSVFLACWIGVIFVIFQAPHSKIANYIFPIFPAIALLTGSFISDALSAKDRSRTALYMLTVTLGIIFLVPLALYLASCKYAAYVPSQKPVYFLIVAFFALAAAMAYFIFRKKLLKGIYALSFAVPVILSSMPLLQKSIEPYVSSKGACGYLLKHYRIDNAILTTGFFITGVKYYSDKEVAMIDFAHKYFFSPHPSLTALDSEKQVQDFLYTQGTTYCILNQSLAKAIGTIAHDFKITALKVIGNQYLFKIERL